MMILVPVLAPGGELQRAEPPNVLARIAFLVTEVREAVDKTLHVQRVDQADAAQPQQALPAEKQSRDDREEEHRAFRVSPKSVRAFGQLRAPLQFVGGCGLIQPAKVCPPEAAMLGAGNIVRRVRQRMMMAVIGDPACRRARAIEHGPENQEVLDRFVYLERAMREQAVITDGSAEAAERDETDRHRDHFPAGDREEDQRGDCQRVDQNKVEQHPELSRSGLPKRTLPRADFWTGGTLGHRGSSVCFDYATGLRRSVLLAAYSCVTSRVIQKRVRREQIVR